MNIYTIYINGIISGHLLSIIFAIVSVLIGIKLLLGRFNIIYTIMFSLLMGQLGNFGYEVIWKYNMGEEFNAVLLYGDVFFALLMLALFINYKIKFININKYTLISLIIFISSIVLLLYTGWYIETKLWILGIGPDPHNFLWAISKCFGFLVPISVLKSKETK